MDVRECEVMDQAKQRNSDSAYSIEQAQSDDVNGILELIRPLEKTGILVKRSKSRIEKDIEAFLIAKWEQQIIGCCAIAIRCSRKGCRSPNCDPTSKDAWTAGRSLDPWSKCDNIIIAVVRQSAKVAELVYALDLGSSARKGLGVRVPPFAP